MRKSTRNLGGVTLLLELLLGFALLSIAVLALFAMIPSGDKAVVRSIRMSQANELARGLLEEQMGKNYSSLVDGERTGNFLDSSVSRNGRNLNLEYLYKVSISPHLTPAAIIATFTLKFGGSREPTKSDIAVFSRVRKASSFEKTSRNFHSGGPDRCRPPVQSPLPCHQLFGEGETDDGQDGGSLFPPERSHQAEPCSGPGPGAGLRGSISMGNRGDNFSLHKIHRLRSTHPGIR